MNPKKPISAHWRLGGWMAWMIMVAIGFGFLFFEEFPTKGGVLTPPSFSFPPAQGSAKGLESASLKKTLYSVFEPITSEPTNHHQPTKPLPIDPNPARALHLSDIASFAEVSFHGLLLDAGDERFQSHIDPKQWSKAKVNKTGDTLQSLEGDSADIELFLPAATSYQARIRADAGRNGAIFSFQSGLLKVECAPNAPGLSVALCDLEALGNLSGYGNITLHLEEGSAHLDYLHLIPTLKAQEQIEAPPSERFPFVRAPEFLTTFEELPAFSIPAGGSVAFHLLVPEQSRLTFQTDLHLAQDNDDPVVFYTSLTNEKDDKKILHVEVFRGERRQRTTAIDLSEYGGRFVRLRFQAVGGGMGDTLTLIDPALRKENPPPIANAWTPPKHVVLWLSDTLRWDKINFIQTIDNPIITPNFDRVARDGITFTNAISQGAWSKPSQAAIMGGRYAWDMKMEEANEQRTRDTTLIASAIKNQRPEVITGSYSSNGYVSDRFGFEQAWDYSRNMIREGKANKTEYLLRAMFPVWESNKHTDAPFFVWFGTIDPHVAYNPRERFLKLYDPEPYSGIVNPWKTAYLLLDIRRGKVKLSDRDWHRLHSLYNGEVSYNDFQFGRLLDKLETWGIADDTAVILISDHGDEFYEHKGMGHGHSLYDELIKVPMIIYYPKGFPRARMVADAVETMAIYPTVLEMLGIEAPKETQASSLLPYAFGAQPMWPNLAVSNLKSHTHLAAIEGWRLILKRNKLMLFDTEDDPYQQSDLIETRPLVRHYMLKRFRHWAYSFGRFQ